MPLLLLFGCQNKDVHFAKLFVTFSMLLIILYDQWIVENGLFSSISCSLSTPSLASH